MAFAQRISEYFVIFLGMSKIELKPFICDSKTQFKFESTTETVDRFTNRSTVLIAKSDNKTATCNGSFWVRCRGTDRPVRGSGRPVRQILPKK